MDESTRLAGLRVLVLEDEALLAMLLEDVLGELGCTLVGPYGHNEEALAFLTANPAGVDFGILDVNVAGHRSDPVALEFDRLGLPFVFSTGYDEFGPGFAVAGQAQPAQAVPPDRSRAHPAGCFRDAAGLGGRNYRSIDTPPVALGPDPRAYPARAQTPSRRLNG